MLKTAPVTLRQAKEYIAEHHRHHQPPVGWKFGVGVEQDGQLVGVGVAGRPVSRHLDNGTILEITRCCTDGTRNAASMVYGALRKAAKALGYTKIITYTLSSENGSSLKASGFKPIRTTAGGSWNCEARPRKTIKAPTVPKTLWEG